MLAQSSPVNVDGDILLMLCNMGLVVVIGDWLTMILFYKLVDVCHMFNPTRTLTVGMMWGFLYLCMYERGRTLLGGGICGLVHYSPYTNALPSPPWTHGANITLTTSPTCHLKGSIQWWSHIDTCMVN